MKVAIPSKGVTPSSDLDPRFGRAHYILVGDPATGELQAHENTQNLNAAQGAGIQTAETVVRLGAKAVISGHVGPKAFRALQAAGVQVYPCGATTVAEALRQFTAGELTETSSATVEGHWA